MRVALDLDNVVVDFHTRWTTMYRTWFGQDATHQDEWDGIVTGTHFEDEAEFFTWFDRTYGWDDLPWIEGAPGGIDNLLSSGHAIVFVTARHTHEARMATTRWLRESPWPDIPLRFSNSKFEVPAGLWIDDSPQVIEGLERAGKDVIVFDQPWNRHLEDFVRADSWAEVLEWVELTEMAADYLADMRATGNPRVIKVT